MNYSPDGSKILSGFKGKIIIEWLVATREYLQSFNSHQGSTSLCYNPNGTRILSGSEDGILKEWLVATSNCINTYINIPNLFIQRCSFHKLNGKSNLSEKAKILLKQYGASV